MKAAIASPFCNLTVLKNTSHNFFQRSTPAFSAVHRHNPSVWHTQFTPYNEKGGLGFFPRGFFLSFGVSDKRKETTLFSRLTTNGRDVRWQHGNDTFSSQNPDVGDSVVLVSLVYLGNWGRRRGCFAWGGREQLGGAGAVPQFSHLQALSASRCWQIKQWH